jgi:thiol:disulfide interchange protein DsbA
MEAYNSFTTQSSLKRDQQLLQNFQIDGVPTLAVQGRYLTGPATTNSLPGAIQVLDYLVAQVRAKKM